MIKFFRKIRKNLLSEGKTEKYFKYAIGEIILVVIGILIALQVNNWNETRKIENNEIELFKNALIDLNQENKDAQTQIRWFKHFQDIHFEIYRQTKDSSSFNPNLDYNTLIWTNIHRPLIQENFGNKVNGMSNENIQELFRDVIWREKLTSEAMNEWNDFKLNSLRPFLAKYGINNTKTSFNHKPYEFMSLDNIQLINYEKLRSKYGSMEFDQILYESRHKASWIIHCLLNMEKANERLASSLEYFINGEIEKSESINSLDSYY
tara:strand:- start:5 stop:796 length:792 start_codon:yes stop_codon:yes gene_type:complete